MSTDDLESGNVKYDSSYYISKGQVIADLGYKNPSTDTDERQRAIWQILKDEGLSLEICIKYDCKNLGSRESNYYKFFQTRSPGEEDITEFYEEFYVLKKRRKRIIFGMMIAGEFFVFLGNKRVRAHEMGIEKGHESLCDIVIIDRHSPMTDIEKCALAHRLARVGNKQQDTTRDETEADYEYQLKVAFELQCKIDPSTQQWSEEQQVEWGKQWIIENISSDYGHASRKSRLTRLVNGAFSANGRGASLPMPSDKDIDKQFKLHYGQDEIWDPSSTKVTMVKVGSRHDLLVQTLYNNWKDREEPSKARKTCWVVARMGDNLDTKITQQNTVLKKRKSVLENIAKYNINPNHIFGGYHLIKRVLFAKQMNTDDYEAWEWNEVSETFNQKRRTTHG